MCIGSDPCYTITGAGIMKMSSMSPYAVDGRASIFVFMSIYVKRVEVHRESDFSIVRHRDMEQRRTINNKTLCGQSHYLSS